MVAAKRTDLLGLVVLFALCSVLASGSAWAKDAKNELTPAEKAAALEKDVTQGALRIVQKDGAIIECPLKHTHVKADVAGFIARVKVTQTFQNPTDEKIEAVYVFPLPHEAAVDDMTMVIGKRKIVGLIKRRAEARQIYEQALAAGQTAALLEQERPNIFTQSVGNIEPGQEINIEISYVDVLKYDMGTYEFHFPMVVGPRYNPGYPTSAPPATSRGLEGKVAPPVADTNRVPDASRISPPVLKPGYRSGHDITLSVALNAGVPIQNLKVANHKSDIQREGERQAAVKLSPDDSLPNKDFVLRYGVVGKKPEMAMLAHTGEYSGDARRLGEGYFMLMIQPKEDEKLKKSPPREIVFLVDTSGSMRGEPTAKVVDAMQNMLKLCREKDTVQVVTFASRAQQLFDAPVPVNEANIRQALNFTQGLKGGGGTEMLKGVKLAIDQPLDKERLRIIVMLTDGYIGNEAEIIKHVGKNCGDRIRFWAIGIGSSPNMFLVDGVARQGGGMGKRLGLKDDTVALTQEVITRIQRAQLADVKIDWGDLKVAETYPARLPELWAGRPVIVYGRYASGGEHEVTVSGNVEGDAISWKLPVTMPKSEKENDVLAKVWARQKIEDLMHQSYYGDSPAVEEMVTALALDYRLMSKYTSFVAVDEKDAGKLDTPARPPRRMMVPVPLPDGTQWEGFFGERSDEEFAIASLGGALKVEKKSTESLARYTKRLASPKQMIRSRRANSLQAFGRPSTATQPAAPGYRAKYGMVPLMAAKMPATGAVYAGRALAIRGRGGPGYGGGFGNGRDGFRSQDEQTSYDVAYTIQALNRRAARQEELQKKATNEAESREQNLRAYFVDAAAANCGRSSGEVAARALEQLEQLHDDQVKDWTKDHSELGNKLDLIIRDKSLSDALNQVAAGAGLQAQLINGSVQDAMALLGRSDLRVAYLDLRGAKVSEALDWILQPARMSWSLEDKQILAGVDRRRPGVSAWVYDVQDIALPLAADLQKLNNYQKALAEATSSAEQFRAVVRGKLKVKDAQSVDWFGPGQILIIGDRKVHADAAKLMTQLRDADAKFAGDAAALHSETKRRAAENQKTAARRLADHELFRVATAHNRFAWQLLAAAAAGDVDLEALTELQIAWRSDVTGKLLEGETAVIALRSLWAVAEAARSLPDSAELQALAKLAKQGSRPAADAALAALEKKQDDPVALAKTLYAAMAFREDQFTAGARRLLTAKMPSHVLAAALVSDAGVTEDQQEVIRQLIDDGVGGADFIALTALVCRRAGGDLWDRFRSQQRDMLGEQPLPGSVIALVNRLPLDQLSMLAD